MKKNIEAIDKPTSINKTLIRLVIVMSIITIGVLGILGYVVYGNYAGNKTTTEIKLDETSNLKVNSDGSAEIVNTSYYSQVGIFTNESLEFTRLTFDDINMSRVTDRNRNKLSNDTNDFIIFLQTFNPTPVTDADKLMHENLLDAKYDIEQVAHHALQFIHTGDFTHRRLHKEYFDNFKIHVNTMSKIEEQYY